MISPAPTFMSTTLRPGPIELEGELTHNPPATYQAVLREQ
jgi:hypothetical protein